LVYNSKKQEGEIKRMGVDDSKIKDVLDSFEKTKTQEQKTKTEKKESIWESCGKYFVHGVGFSIIFAILTIVWAVILAFLVIVGFIVGLVIGLGLLLLFVGFVNSFLMSMIWGVSTKSNFLSVLSHGIVLLIALLLVGVIFMIPLLIDSSITMQILIIVISAIPRGFVAKKVGDVWKVEGVEETAQYEGLEHI
jgi:hypothetical protein